MNLQKISLPEIQGSSNKTFTILECLPRHLHHLRISPQSTSTVSGYLYSPPPFSWNVSPDICTISDVFAIHSIIFGFLLGRLCHISPGPYRGTDINIAWHKIQQCARAIHLAVDTLPQILVGMVPRAGTLILAAPGSRGIATHICIGILTVR